MPVGGYGNSHEALANDHMLILLQNHPAFALRCARSPFELFFGPTRELLREVALHLHATWIRERWRRPTCCSQKKAALVSIFLQEADALAIERRHAPGCAGFLEAHQSFHAAAQAMCPCEGGSGAAAGPSGSVHARRRRVRIKSRVTGQNQDGCITTCNTTFPIPLNLNQVSDRIPVKYRKMENTGLGMIFYL